MDIYCRLGYLARHYPAIVKYYRVTLGSFGNRYTLQAQEYTLYNRQPVQNYLKITLFPCLNFVPLLEPSMLQVG